MSLDQLNYSHPFRSENVKRWNFLYNSYVGGEQYRAGRYLHQYWGENQAPFDAYQRRLEATPLDNHVRTTVDIYRSYIWKNPPSRQFGPLENNEFVKRFLGDADLNGQTIDSWMKNALDWAMVLGQIWILVDKPAYSAESAAEELENDFRAYVTMYTPQNVLDWRYDRMPNGRKVLSYIKTLEGRDGDYTVLKEWTPEVILCKWLETDELTGEYTKLVKTEEYENTLGRVPFVSLAPQPLPGGDTGVSLLGDVADMQRSIYNKLSELEQNIRISNHPVLVKTADAIAEAGAGAIINIDGDENTMKPYLLEPSGASIEGILKSIEHDIESINAMTHLSAVRGQKGAMSGVALQTERQLLNAKLGDLSDTVRETEQKIWELWCEWMDIDNSITIEYSHHFDTRDPMFEQDKIGKAMELVNDPAFTNWAKEEIVKLVVRNEEEMNTIISNLVDNNNINNNDNEE